jgi:hypothetical protein
MTEPERLFHGSESPLARAMLGAAREEAPSDRLLERTLLAVSVGAVVVGTASTVAGAAGTTSLSAVAAKWFGIGAVGGLLTMGAAVGVEHALSRPAEVVVTTAAPVVPRVDVTRATPGPVKPAVEVPAPETPKPAAAALASVSAPKPVSSEPSIERELREIDAARSALASGDSAKALALVDAYERQPGTKQMFQEALAIRMEAQAKSGNTTAARASAERLLVVSPNGPHASRARQILSR